jgi:hypothetical protein
MSVITVRVSKKTKAKLQKYNVNVSETVREMLEKCVKELEQKDLEDRLERIKDRFSDKIDSEMIVKLIREDRESH